MNTKTLVMAVLLGIAASASAQVRVYFVEGDVSYQQKPGDVYEAIEVADSLLATGEIRVGESSRVVLFDGLGNNILIKSPGRYRVGEVIADLKEDNSEIAAFFSYVWKKLMKKKVKAEDENENSTGVVSRGKEFMFVSPADSSIIFDSALKIELINGSGPFTITVFTEGELIDEKVLREPRQSYQYRELLQPNKVYEMIATDDKGTSSEPVFFIIYDKSN